jgi:hypothetical protein
MTDATAINTQEAITIYPCAVGFSWSEYYDCTRGLFDTGQNECMIGESMFDPRHRRIGNFAAAWTSL